MPENINFIAAVVDSHKSVTAATGSISLPDETPGAAAGKAPIIHGNLCRC